MWHGARDAKRLRLVLRWSFVYFTLGRQLCQTIICIRCALLVLLSGCATTPQGPVHVLLSEFSLSPQHRTEGSFTFVSIEDNGLVHARISHEAYSARVGDYFVATDGSNISEYVLKAVDQRTGQVVIQPEARR